MTSIGGVGETNSSISVRGMWKVYGPKPERIVGSDGPVVESDLVKALAAGAQVKMPLADQFWGDRYGQLTDPFGFTWSIGAPVAAPPE